MQNSSVKIFEFASDKQVRVVVDEMGEPWFVAKDVCDILELTNPTVALENLDADERAKFFLGRQGEANIISEPGLYALTMRSNKPAAKQFKRWVTHEVLPTIRKHGVYATPDKLEEMLSDPDSWIKTLQALKAEREQRIKLEAKVEQDAPKVLFADSVAASETSILIGDLAKLIKQNGVDIGQNKLFEFLRHEGWLISRKGASYNMPSQKGMERGYFEIKERTVDNPDGSIRITRTPKVTGKGQIYFVELFVKHGSNFELAI